MKLSARKILSLYFQIGHQLKTIRSATGQQLEQHIMGSFGLATRASSEDTQVLFLTLSSYLRELTKPEFEVCELRYGTNGKLTTYEKLVPDSKLTRKVYEDGSCELITEDGESLISLEAGTGCALVIGWRRECLSYAQISELLKISKYQVKLLDHSACDKVREAVKNREDL